MAVKLAKILLLLIITILVAMGFWVYYVRQYINKPFQVDAPGYIVNVPAGTSVQKIADKLAEDKIMKHPSWFVSWVRSTDARNKIKAGEYLIKPGMTPKTFVEMLVAGRVMQHPITIVEGWTFQQLLQAIQQESNLTQTLVGLTPEEIMAKIGHPNEHPEGRFFPDTYHFPLGTTDMALLQRAYRTLQDKLEGVWATRDPELPFKQPYEALILASLIEKESCVVDEYGEIAGVYVRRLLRNMPLQADPTVIYGAGKNYTGVITNEMLKTVTPYNTYTNSGLPPTPIAFPGKKALYAATHPKPGKTLYFVARPDGKGHVFSETLEAHQGAVKEYRSKRQEAKN